MKIKKALSIKQPWAYLIAAGIKDIENRTWKTNYRGEFLIHASKRDSYDFRIAYNKLEKIKLFPRPLLHFINRYGMDDEEPVCYHDRGLIRIVNGEEKDIFEFGAILGKAEIIDCVKDSRSVWAEPGCWHLVIKNAVLYDRPIINVRGALNFWNYKEAL